MRRIVPLLLLMAAWPGAAQQPRSGSADAALLLKEAAAVQRKTAQLRGLRVRRPIAMGVQSRAAILRKVERRLARDFTVEEIEAEAAVLKRLGLIPETLDYRREVLELLKDQVAGYYDPLERKLHLADWLPVSLQRPALSHEVCHALQDQHFDIKRLIRPLKENSDRQLAQSALVEGDCTGVMLEFVLASQGQDLGSISESQIQAVRAALASTSSGRFTRAPRFLQETLLFPYLHGLRLIQEVRALHPWSTVSQMFKRPPDSTEQVLHPDKYWRREAPAVIRPAPLRALTSYARLKQDSLGEFQLFLLLNHVLEQSLATRATEGWAGDLLQAFRRGSGPLLIVHLSTWDAEVDAIEFVNAARHWLLARKLKAHPLASGDSLWVYREGAELEWSAQRAGEHVLLLMGAPAPLRARLQQEVWAEWRVGGRRIQPPASRPAAGG